jgi:hypothetical protein
MGQKQRNGERAVPARARGTHAALRQLHPELLSCCNRGHRRAYIYTRLVAFRLAHYIAEPGILKSEVGCGKGKLRIPVGGEHLLWSDTKDGRVEVCYLSRNAGWQGTGIEVRDVADPRATGDAGVPEVVFPDAVWGYYPKPGDHYSSLHRFSLWLLNRFLQVML